MVAVHRGSDGAGPLLPPAAAAAAALKGEVEDAENGDDLTVAVNRDGEGTRQIEEGWK